MMSRALFDFGGGTVTPTDLIYLPVPYSKMTLEIKIKQDSFRESNLIYAEKQNE